MTRTRIALIVTTLGLTLLAGAGLVAAMAAPAGPADVSDEVFALQALEQDAAAPEPGRSPGRFPGARKYLRKNTLHGEVTVQGENGVRTIVVQRGTVTAADGRTVSVKSADGFALTWTVGDPIKVRGGDVNAVKAGVQVGVAGGRDGETVTARLIRIG